MSEASLFAELRRVGIDVDHPEIRAALRAVARHVEDVERREGPQHARRCMEAMHTMLAYQLRHPDVADMSSFEAAFDQERPTEG